MSAANSFRRRLQHGRVLLIEPEISDGLLPAQKNALVARRRANRTGHCPSCGAELTVGETVAGVTHAFFEHEAGCAVADPLGAA